MFSDGVYKHLNGFILRLTFSALQQMYERKPVPFVSTKLNNEKTCMKRLFAVWVPGNTPGFSKIESVKKFLRRNITF